MTTEKQPNSAIFTYIDFVAKNDVQAEIGKTSAFGEEANNQIFTFKKPSFAWKMVFSLINLFFFSVFIVSLFSPFNVFGIDLFEIHGLEFVAMRYLNMTTSIIFIGAISLKLEGESIINSEELQWLVGRKISEKENLFAVSMCYSALLLLWYAVVLVVIIACKVKDGEISSLMSGTGLLSVYFPFLISYVLFIASASTSKTLLRK